MTDEGVPRSEEAPRTVLIRISDGQLGYGREAVLWGVNLELRAGDFLGVVGPNGTGKTTLLRTVLGVLPLQAGRREVNARLGYAPQRSNLDPIYPFLAREVVAMGLGGPAQRDLSPSGAEERVAAAMKSCGISELSGTPVRDMSGGQKQRVIVARALVSDPEVLILDEPTNDLDMKAEHEVMELLQRLNGEGRTIVMVTHLLHLVATYADRFAFIEAGQLQVGEAAEMLTPERLSALFGTGLVVVEVGGRRVVAPALSGDGAQ